MREPEFDRLKAQKTAMVARQQSDLLRALKALVRKVEQTSECDHTRLACEDIGCIGVELKAARAAIAKAEGR